MILEILIVFSTIFIIIYNKFFNLDIDKCLKIFFVLLIVSAISSVFSSLTPHISYLGFMGSFVIYFAFAIVLLHSTIKMGNKKTFLFFLISLAFGLFSEAIGVKYGLIFGNYYYNLPNFFFGTVPLITPITWAVIIYVSYTTTNLFLHRCGEKPKKSDENWYFIPLAILLSSIDGLIAMNMDMIIDPIAVSKQIPAWVWIGGGPYFGVPLSNFVGWFLVTFTATIIFRSYESISSMKDKMFNNNDFFVFSIYLVYFLYYVAQSIKIDRLEYILIGSATMGPFIILILLMLITSKKGDKN